VRQRTYKTKAETEAKKPVTATIVLTLLFISGARAARHGDAGCLPGPALAADRGACLPPAPLLCSGGAHAAVLRIHQQGE
jgi:hypothetical protein